MCKKPYLIDVVKRNRGYTLMELMMVLSIIAILAQIGFTAWMDNKRRAYDASAVADTRNLIEAIVNDMVGAEDVDYTHGPDDGPRIGNKDKYGDPKTPSLFLSPGVKAQITGGTDLLDTGTGITNTFVEANIWHSGGTPWNSANEDKTREFYALVDEAGEIIEFVGFKVR